MTTKNKSSAWKEYTWYALLIIIPFLSFKVITSAMWSFNKFEESGVLEYQNGFVLIASLVLILSLLVPYLLKDSESSFKVGAIILTSIIPAALTAWCWYRLTQLG